MPRFRFSLVRSALTPLRAALLLLLAIAPWAAPRAVFALTYTSVASGNWSVAATWDQTAVPPDGEPVVIAAGHNVIMDGNRNPGALTIHGTLQLNGSLTAGGDLTVMPGGTLDLRNPTQLFQGTTFTNNGALVGTFGTGDFRFNGVAGAASTTQAIAGTGTYNSNGNVQLTVQNTTTLAPASGATLDGVLQVVVGAGSTLSLANAFLVKNATGTTTIINNGTVSGAGTLKTQGTVSFSSVSWSAPLEVESGTTAGGGNVGALTVDNAATFNQAGTLTVSGDLTLASGGTLDLKNPSLFFQGTTFTNNGSLISSLGGDFRFNGVAGANGTTQHGGASTGTASAVLNLFNGTTVVLDGSFALGAPNVQSGTTLTSLASGTLTLAGTLTNNGTVLLNGSGGSCGSAGKISIRSSVNGTQRSWQGGGSFTLSDLDVKDQSAASARVASGSVDSGNNTNWSFPLCPGFYTVPPCRVLDTRTAPPNLSSGVPRTVPIVAGGCGIPATADAVVFNLTVANVPATGSLVAYPNAGPAPGTSTISFRAGQDRANNGAMALAADLSGTLQAMASFSGGGTLDLIVDVSGYFIEP